MRTGRRLGAGLIGVALAIGIVAGSALAADANVRIEGLAFTPGTVTVSVGDTVTWRNQDSAGHTATAAGGFDTGTIAPGATAAITFDTAGSFTYVCTIHPQMTGTVVVEAGAGGAPPPPTDTLPAATEPATSDPTAVTAILLAVLGVAMLVSTLAFQRRGRS